MSGPHTSTPTTRRWPWLVAGGTLVVFLVACLYYPDVRSDPVFIAVFTPIISAFLLVGAVLATRVRGNPVGPLLLGSGVCLAMTIAAGSAAEVAINNGGAPSGLLAIAILINQIGFVVPIVVVLIGVPLVFPDGRLLSARWRWIVALAVSAMAAVTVSAFVTPGTVGDTEVPNPFAIAPLEQLAVALDAYANLSSVVGFGAALLALVLRYRRGSPVERQQVKWLVAVASVAGVAFPVAFVVPNDGLANVGFLVGLAALFALPVAIGIAILRYRLYEIDRLISRTIGWAIISGVLVAAFAVSLVALQALFAGQTLAVAASTLAVFALSQPLRGRVQGAVDRRFDRARYDAQRTAAAFAARLRDEVELEVLTRELERTVADAIRPSSTALWLPGRRLAD